jgi:hypothetical protein
MISSREFGNAIIGVRHLVRLDVRGFAFFSATLDGFWNSFWAAAILAPFSAAMLIYQITTEPPQSIWRSVAFQAIGYVIGWLAFPLMMVRICKFLGRGDRYFIYMVTYNWFHLVEIAVWGPVLILGMIGVIPPIALTILSVAALGILLFYEWFVARRALAIPGMTAAAIVAIDLVLGLIITRLADSLA